MSNIIYAHMNRMMIEVLSTIQFYIPGQYIIVKHKFFKNADQAVLPQGIKTPENIQIPSNIDIF